MTAQFAIDAQQAQLTHAVARFLADPPPGTPTEIVHLLTLIAGNPADPLPPRLYFEAVEQAPVAISITDAQANILYVNAAFERLTGYDRQDALGRNESILSNKATPQAIYRQLWETIRNRQVWTGTLVNRARDGGDYLAELTISPVLDAAGEPRYFLGMHRDVTREHALEVGARLQQARIETVLNAAPVLFALVDAAGAVLLDNLEYRKLRGDLRGAEPLALLRQTMIAQAGFDPLARALDGGDFKDAEIRLDVPGRGEPRWLSCSGTSVSESDASARGYFANAGDGERRLLLLANDVTARRREIDRAHLENLRARLAEQQLAHGMREALTAACYQIQAPLNLIRAATAMFGTDGGGHLDIFADTLRQISAASETALHTLQTALPAEIPETGGPVNVNELLRHVLELETDRLLAAGVVVDWRPAPHLPELSGHKNQLRSLFKHLLDNALQALHESRRDHRELRLITRVLDDAIEVIVEDNGPGFPAGDRFKAFEPFYIGWRKRQGRAGMGLTLAAEIANQHGGSIDIDPDFADGCRVRLILSRTPPEAP